ncbi:alpha/beta-hydrolase [Pilatotrama ljubarskyi]|nr:alpha/beta-hydrolase [Pilatotrama ljubarskyi]
MGTRAASSLRPLHPPNLARAAIQAPITRNVEIKVKDPLDHAAPAILHEPRDYDPVRAKNGAVILISGAGGGVSGPAGIYPSLADKFASLLHIPCIRLDYRQPARNKYCTPDVLASMSYLSSRFQSDRFVLVGWSFGGAPCFTVAAREPERVVGVATVASQTADTDGIEQLAPRPVLLLHGTGDTCLSPRCAQNLYRAYGEHPHGQRQIRLFEGDNHGLTKNAPQVEKMIFEFAARCLGLAISPGAEEKAGHDLVGSEETRVREMAEGQDLAGGEHL